MATTTTTTTSTPPEPPVRKKAEETRWWVDQVEGHPTRTGASIATILLITYFFGGYSFKGWSDPMRPVWDERKTVLEVQISDLSARLQEKEASLKALTTERIAVVEIRAMEQKVANAIIKLKGEEKLLKQREDTIVKREGELLQEKKALEKQRETLQQSNDALLKLAEQLNKKKL